MPINMLTPELQALAKQMTEQDMKRAMLRGVTPGALQQYEGPGDVSKVTGPNTPGPAYPGAGAYAPAYFDQTKVGDTSSGPFGPMKTTQVYDAGAVPPDVASLNALPRPTSGATASQQFNLGPAQQRALGVPPAPQSSLAQGLLGGAPSSAPPPDALAGWRQQGGILNPDVIPAAIASYDAGSKHQIGMETAGAHKLAAEAAMAQATGQDQKERSQMRRMAYANYRAQGMTPKRALDSSIADEADYDRLEKASRQAPVVAPPGGNGSNPNVPPPNPPVPPAVRHLLPSQLEGFSASLADPTDMSALAKQLGSFVTPQLAQDYPNAYGDIGEHIGGKWKVSPEQLQQSLANAIMPRMAMLSPGGKPVELGGLTYKDVPGGADLSTPGMDYTLRHRFLTRELGGLGSSIPTISRFFASDKRKQDIQNNELKPLSALMMALQKGR